MEQVGIIALRFLGGFVLLCWLVEGCISVYRWMVNRKIRDEIRCWKREQARRER